MKGFHGGLYLLNSDHAEVNDNVFHSVSFSILFNIGDHNHFRNNRFTFPDKGNALDIVFSKDTTFVDNIIETSTNYGINIIGSDDVVIKNNKITDSLSYGIMITSPLTKNIEMNICHN